MAHRNPGMLFPIFTNGTLIDRALIRDLRTYRNLIPILSLEGGSTSTDQRRGNGIHNRVHSQMRELRRAGVFFGVSFTVMKGNVEEVSEKEFVRALVREGAGVFFYNEYTPVLDGSENLCIDGSQRAKLLSDLEVRRKEVSALFLAFPGDEDRYGGCLASGRGFVHIAPDPITLTWRKQAVGVLSGTGGPGSKGWWKSNPPPRTSTSMVVSQALLSSPIIQGNIEFQYLGESLAANGQSWTTGFPLMLTSDPQCDTEMTP